MFYALGWAVIAMLIGMWSVFMWLATSVFQWTLHGAGQLKAEGLVIPESMQSWIPAEFVDLVSASITAVASAFDVVTGLFPMLASAVTVLGWTVWGVGTALLVAAGGLGHVGLRIWLRKSRQQNPVNELRTAH